MSPEAKKFVDGVGATAEACGIFYKSYIAQGFSIDQALDLTKTFLAGIVMQPADKSDD